MPTLSASDYTTFIKAQAASQAYRNGAIPIPIQTRAQPFLNQSILNAQLLTSQAAYVVAPSKIVVERVPTTISAASATTLTGATNSDGNTTITYTSSVAHGLTAGMVVSISGFTGGTTVNFNLANQTVIANGLTATVFKVDNNTAIGTTTTTSTTGRINGYVYYTTAAAHTLPVTNTQNITITGLSTSAFNLTLANVALTPSSTVFAIANSATGSAVTGASGLIDVTRYPNRDSTIIGNARVLPYSGYGNVNNPKSLVTLTQSGTLSSSKTQQTGGLPTTAPKWSGVYAPTPQLARVDTKATGAYKAVRQPV
jgi:hypothetical protein